VVGKGRHNGGEEWVVTHKRRTDRVGTDDSDRSWHKNRRKEDKHL